MSEMFNEKYRRPNISFTEMLKKGAAGQFRERSEYSQFMYRALVIACDTQGGKLEGPKGEPLDGSKLTVNVRGRNSAILATYEITPTFGPFNPKNSVRARIISNNVDQVLDDDSLRTFWPMFPGADTPSAGEVVYVVFEDEGMQHGLWLAKAPIAEPDPSDPNAPKTTKNLILMGETLRDIDEGKAQLWRDAAPVSPAPGLSPIRKQQRLTSLFMG